MKLERKLKIALDESRLLMLAAQVIFGFQFNGIFQELFKQLPLLQRILACAGLTLLMVAIACLITPSMEHRIVERGQDNPRVLMLATIFTGCALLPFSLALAFDLFSAMQQIASLPTALFAAGSFFALAVFFLYVLEFLVQEKRLPRVQAEAGHSTPLEYQVEQLLTEARLIMPGAQALLGFQLTVTLTRAFAELPTEAKVVHAAALCCIGLAVLLLMSPASLHRIAFAGEDSLKFLRLGSGFLIAAPLPLACGIALDTYVAAGRALESEAAAAALAVTAIVVLLGAWYGYPILRRMRERP